MNRLVNRQQLECPRGSASGPEARPAHLSRPSLAWIRSGRRACGPAPLALLALLALALGACSSAGRVASAPIALDAVAPQPATPDDLPPEAKAGEAWCRVWIPPVTKEISETVCVSPACVKKVPIPPTYDTRTKLVCIQPAKICEVTKPAVWTTRKREVLVCPEREVVERVQCEPSELGEGEVQCNCFVKRIIPPVYETIEEGVCLEPSSLCVEYQPAQYKCVEERFVVKPAHCEEVAVPARYETRIRTVICQCGRWEWRRNDACELPDPGLTAIEVTMIDTAPDGTEAGIFLVGQEVRYDLEVLNDLGGKALQGLRVVFSLPAELEYVSGGGDGLQMVGQARQAESTPFALDVNQKVSLRIIARVLSKPAQGNLIQTVASVVGADGAELVHESESTTVGGAP